jgi:hypothetical protein
VRYGSCGAGLWALTDSLSQRHGHTSQHCWTSRLGGSSEFLLFMERGGPIAHMATPESCTACGV